MFLFLTVIFVFLLYFYAKYYWGSRPDRRRAHFIFAAGNAAVPSRGLDPAVLSSIPITLYRPSDFKDGLECAVCLSELAAGEEVRLLPKCRHGFHLECIDMWFQSHSTCPICRCTVGPESSDRNLMISIPTRSTEGLFSSSVSPLPSSRSQIEEIKTPVEDKRSPATPKLWSLRRILSMGKRTSGSPSSSPRINDIEQGLVGSVAENGEGSSSKSPTSSF
ncbi:RING-H2 finger protein ATL3 [Dendrobium catenatum]|uniref:RING-type E3 ubiquitin transferase n=1 Tax=Dendrobium catenatum TaxID=906689 RepID=A0A2I0VZG9_9ASPA|nr:RING-H2 finger protein ATL3 [Dendrobium catenatum]